MSINKYQFSLQHPSIQQCCQSLQKGALNLTEIQHKDRHGDHMGSSFPQFCSNQSRAAFPFRQTKPTLYFHAFTFIKIILRFVPDLTLPGSAQGQTG